MEDSHSRPGSGLNYPMSNMDAPGSPSFWGHMPPFKVHGGAYPPVVPMGPPPPPEGFQFIHHHHPQNILRGPVPQMMAAPMTNGNFRPLQKPMGVGPPFPSHMPPPPVFDAVLQGFVRPNPNIPPPNMPIREAFPPHQGMHPAQFPPMHPMMRPPPMMHPFPMAIPPPHCQPPPQIMSQPPPSHDMPRSS